MLSSASFQAELEAVRQLPRVDYRRQMVLKRRALEELCRCCFADASGRLDSLQRFAEEHPVVADYARFRAAVEKQHSLWPSWPSPLREGILKEGDYDESVRRYHLYVQWLAHQQVEEVAQKAGETGVGLQLDLPLGAHPEGYDTWRNQDIFVRDVDMGAPPDTFFTRGQDWACPPLHPEKLRQQGYRYYIDCLRHHLRQAAILRIDHVMGFHRLFWIPKGMDAKQGLYVRYPAEEFYAILTIESQRHKAIIVGEDLGTVPPEVRPAMSRHNLRRMYVLQFDLTPDPKSALATAPTGMVASLNTHDMPTFAAFWQGLDILDRKELGLLNETSARQEMARRQSLKQALVGFLQQEGLTKEPSDDLPSVLRAVLAFLSASQAGVVLVNLEDLWLETLPQNTPGTWRERPNWRRKARYSFDTFQRLSQVTSELHEIDRIRKGGIAQNNVKS